MFTLLSGLWKYFFQKDEFYVLILGLDNAGKTTYLEKTKTKFNKNYKGMNPSKITATVGLNIGRVDLSGIRLNFWDLGGQEELQSLWDKYYAECHAVIYVIDSSDTERLEESRDAFDKMLGSESLDEVPLLVLVNKQDIQNSLPVSSIKNEFKNCSNKIGHRDCRFMGVSALKGENVREGIDWLVQCIQRNSLTRPPTQKDIT